MLQGQVATISYLEIAANVPCTLFFTGISSFFIVFHLIPLFSLTGGHLASIHSQSDQDTMEALITGSCKLQSKRDTSFSKVSIENAELYLKNDDFLLKMADYFAIRGTAWFGYTNWAGGEPNDWQGDLLQIDLLQIYCNKSRTIGRVISQGARVSFQWKNQPDFLLRDPDCLIRHPDLLSGILISY